LKNNSASALTLAVLPVVLKTNAFNDKKNDKAISHMLAAPGSPQEGSQYANERFILVYDDNRRVVHLGKWVAGTAIASPHNFIVDTKGQIETFFPGLDVDEFCKMEP